MKKQIEQLIQILIFLVIMAALLMGIGIVLRYAWGW